MKLTLQHQLRTLTSVQQAIIKRTIIHVKQVLNHDKTGHDWWHIYRVWQISIYIAKQEDANSFIVQLAALLHDIADWKFHDGDDKASAKVACEWLTKLQVEKNVIDRICDIINAVTFKGAGVKTQIETLEGKIVQDADRLDALGAIGIARAFTYGGYKSIPIYDPTVVPKLHFSFEEYKNHHGTTINHFYEKLLLLKNSMNTVTGKKIAELRHEFLEKYLDQFFSEWNITLEK